MSTTFTLRPIGRSGEGSDSSKWDHVYQYEVLGLPPAQRATIAEMEGRRWKTLRTQDGVQGSWVGEYETAEDALGALQREIGT
jgi:hypothetical protein